MAGGNLSHGVGTLTLPTALVLPRQPKSPTQVLNETTIRSSSWRIPPALPRSISALVFSASCLRSISQSAGVRGDFRTVCFRLSACEQHHTTDLSYPGSGIAGIAKFLAIAILCAPSLEPLEEEEEEEVVVVVANRLPRSASFDFCAQPATLPASQLCDIKSLDLSLPRLSWLYSSSQTLAGRSTLESVFVSSTHFDTRPPDWWVRTLRDSAIKLLLATLMTIVDASDVPILLDAQLAAQVSTADDAKAGMSDNQPAPTP
ncbi:hypothetical protein CC80DRAFT_558439 [Byssothecium circinans]|uniref:Uncharacterized protein n=1 Tax=Byssothecium circinans TaxID=147558 RepID=A0A6A5U7K9_9PLEO|nr:hypothetical protein CC80DRAFT_558439 [Byssothecium circinans]